MLKSASSRALGLLFLAVLSPGLVHAQGTPLSQVLPVLLGNTITLQPSNLADQPNHVAHFQPGSDQLRVPSQVNEAVLTSLSTYPIGTPGGGFTYVFDPALGSLTRSSNSFGPSFAERALTTGRGKVSVGFGFQRATYDTFEGLNLRQRGEGTNLRQRGIVFYIPHTDCCSPGTASASTPDNSTLTPPFEGDLIRASLGLDLVSETSTLFATYGVSDRFDIGLAIPFVRVKLNASVLAHIERLSTASEPETHQFDGPNPDEHLFSLGGTAAGIGDIALRAKYRVPAGRFGIAGLVEARVPTGDEMNLLGTGGVQTKVLAILTYARGPLSPHVNLGYTFASEGALPNATMHDEGLATVGADYAMTSRITMSFDVLGRTVRDAGRMRLTDKIYRYTLAGGGAGGGGGGGGGGSGGGRPPSVAEALETTRTELQFYSGNLNLYLGAAGLRFNPWRTLLVSANLLFPLTKTGLRDRVTPAIGVDYVF